MRSHYVRSTTGGHFIISASRQGSLPYTGTRIRSTWWNTCAGLSVPTLRKPETTNLAQKGNLQSSVYLSCDLWRKRKRGSSLSID